MRVIKWVISLNDMRVNKFMQEADHGKDTKRRTPAA